jgi:iron(III) transport system permease protein
MSWGLLIDSCLLAFLVTFLAVVIGWCVSLFLVGASGWKRVIFLVGVVSSFSLPPFLVVNTWLSLFGKVGLLKSWFLLDAYSFGGAAWVLAMMFWPVPCLMSFGALKRLTPELLDAEPGLRGWGLVKCVLFPISYSALFQSGVIVFVLAFNNIAVPAILQVKVFPAQFWVQFSSTYNFQMAWQYGWVLALIPMVILLAFSGRTIAWPWESQGLDSNVFLERIGYIIRHFSTVLFGAIIVVSLLLPLGHLLLNGRTWLGFSDAIQAGSRSIFNSFCFAFLTATLVSIIGALTSSLKGFRLTWLFLFLPGVLLGVVWISIFNRPFLDWFYGSGCMVVTALGLRYFALGWEGMRGAKNSIDTDLVNATDLFGLPWWQRWIHLLQPQVGWAIFAVWYVIYLLCLWDTETVVLIVPPGGETLALRVFNLLHYGHHAQVNALCLILLLLALLPLILGFLVRLMIKKWLKQDES